MLLAIDTSAGTSTAVVDRDGGVLAERIETDSMRHAEVVGELIRAMLDESGIPVSALSGVVAGMGPGPFTGLRVGIAAAKAFAFGAGKPLVPVVSHDAVAYERYADGDTGPLLVVTDARRRERYWTAYSGADELGLPVRLDGPGLARPDDLPHPEVERLEAWAVPAGRLGMLAELRYANGLPFDADEPLYLRSPDVTLSAGPKRVSA
ncbi:tRNA (adenosine(37)-N6)-threonylcarbamoyltransferase complex dimerization subunit type 1 TsaB [Leifsonia sp. F6_8S_P_1B]|uniref:tRNA (Adenosine(37)-N6)-threonylcarbamoyltransferase complex dimerization subunit type 1 TsaB n=1 Tax=Leifsonia williamsii TaxID=3035919 RepID=A0ABT8KFG5_9MICO|nr:tRNA (adenosine(37)-N6)-threonylcarbamoyltransferase complex dimerization subunit type 1 TsaB [Leifsonia williamsii]MDN4616179.1 tRNA (adenosine(37)-N6)-threonylcarbamoyltransferase complex dimerization subunit type 1 TsaB [Leifsonia williamsii]